MRFTKMQGLGNDYLYVWGEVPENIVELAQRLSNRRFGAGADGMIYISTSDIADFKMRIFNADGSEARMCGNGIRCVGKYVYEKGYTQKTSLTVETLSGIRELWLNVEGGEVRSVKVDMGRVIVSDDICICEVVCTPVNVGNPHAVIFTDDAENAPLFTLGAMIERHEAFPDRTNVEFVQVIGENELRMRVWERGSGVTMACGTGACASAAAAVSKGFCRAYEPIKVHLDGGILEIRVEKDYKIYMTGTAEFVYEGEII